jgi:hypothetical protein
MYTALLERVLLRLASCEGEEQLQQQINALLCPILLKFETADVNVRSKLMEILSHINKAWHDGCSTGAALGANSTILDAIQP